VNPHAYNMRTDYVVVSPNSRAYTRAWCASFVIAYTCAPEEVFQEVLPIIHRDFFKFGETLPIFIFEDSSTISHF